MSEFKSPRQASIIRVLVVDDSAFVRKVVREILSRSPFIEVAGFARNGIEALELAESLKPDVVTCDLTMPEMDGPEFIRRQMAKKPLPILALTASPKDGSKVIEALDAGAIDLVRKPSAAASQDLFTIREELVEKIKEACKSSCKNYPIEMAPRPSPLPSPIPHRKADLLAIGVSTGGPQALRFLLPQLPRNFPIPILLALHMPVGYTTLFAEKLDSISQIKVMEAQEGMPLRAGQALLAPGGQHLVAKKTREGWKASLQSEPSDKPHKPSVDVLFQSASEAFQNRLIAVVLTGMGSDGLEGAGWVKAKGGVVLTESEESAVIYGMPRCVAEAGLSDGVFHLNRMAETILKYL
jgi:two-component system chemotaxis response regulator CheB